MIKLLLLITTLFYKLKFNEAIVKYDLKSNVTVQDEGPMSYTLYIKSIDMFIQPIQNDFCDAYTGYSWQHDVKYCDYRIWIYYCYDRNLKFGQDIFIQRTGYFSYKSPGFTDISFINDPNSPDQPCDRTKIFIGWDINFVYYDNAKMRLVTKQKIKYPYKIYILSLISDDDGKQDEVYMEVRFPNNLRINNYSDSSWQGTTFYKDIGFYETTTWSECEPNYKGSTCWLYCVTDTRQDCVCDQSKKIDFACTIKCKGAWTGFVMSVKVLGQIYDVTLCNLKNLCIHNDPCKSGETCLAKNNDSVYCEIINYTIISQLSDTEIVSRTFFIGEMLVIRVDDSIIKEKEIIPYISFRPDLTSIAITMGVFSDVKYSTHLQMKIEDTQYIDITLYLYFYMILDAWDKELYLPLIFRINKLPDEIIDVFHKRDLKSVMFRVYYGENLFCNTSGLPKYRTMILWKSNVLNISEPFLPTIPVSVSIPTVVGFVVCKEFLFTYKRHQRSVYSFKKIRVHPYVIFKWSLRSDIISRKWDSLKCLIDTYTQFTVTIIKVEGFTELYLTTDEVPLKIMRGDLYVLICIYRTNYGYLATRTKEFILSTEPSTLCLFIFTQIPGGLVQCSHDGYPQEKFIIFVKIFVSLTDERPLSAGMDYTRLPYDMALGTFTVLCELSAKHSIDRVLMNSTQNFDIYPTVSYAYTFKKSNKLCATLSEPIEVPDYEKFLSKDELVLWHYIFFLEIPYIMTVNLPSIVVLLIMILFAFYYLVLMHLMLDPVDSSTINFIRRFIRWHKVRVFQDQLIYGTVALIAQRELPKTSSSRSNTIFKTMMYNNRLSNYSINA